MCTLGQEKNINFLVFQGAVPSLATGPARAGDGRPTATAVVALTSPRYPDVAKPSPVCGWTDVLSAVHEQDEDDEVERFQRHAYGHGPPSPVAVEHHLGTARTATHRRRGHTHDFRSGRGRVRQRQLAADRRRQRHGGRRRALAQRHGCQRRHPVPRRRSVVPRLHTHHVHGGVRHHTGRRRGRQHDGADRHTQVQGHAQLD